jgi:hypothetical protein
MKLIHYASRILRWLVGGGFFAPSNREGEDEIERDPDVKYSERRNEPKKEREILINFAVTLIRCVKLYFASC